MMAVVAVMAVCAVLLALGIVGSCVVMSRMHGGVMIVVMHMHAHCIHARMSMKSQSHRPGGLERDDEHDKQGDETAHVRYSTGVKIKANMVVSYMLALKLTTIA